MNTPFRLRRRAGGRRLRALLVACAAAPALAQAWSAEDLVSSARVPAAVPSPDGERVAYVVERADLQAQPSTWRGALHIATADGAERRRFTARDARISHPRWSPDGDWIGYLRKRGDEPAQLMVIALDGGAPRQLTGFAEGVEDFRWSPHGNAIVVLRPDPAPQPAAANAPPDAIVLGDALPARHLWWLSFSDGESPGAPRRLTGGDFQVGHGLLGAAFDWSPDGRTIAFTRVRSGAPQAWTSADVMLVDVGSGQLEPFQQSNAAEFDPRFSPDGQRVAFNITLYPPSWIRQSRIGLAKADGSGLKLLAVTPDQQPELVGWQSERALLVREPHRTTTSLWTLPADGAAPRRFDSASGVLNAVTLNQPGTRLALVASSADSPPEAAVTTLRRFRPERVSRANASPASLPAATTRRVRWRSRDGAEIEGLLTAPDGSGPHALILLVHGGPAGMFADEYLGQPTEMMPVAALAAAGYATLRANPRGSSGYGYEFRAAVREDFGGVDYQDLMSGVDHLVEAGLADPDRLGIAGWSYGGYLSAWATSRNHRFGAAVAGAAIADLAMLSNTIPSSEGIADYLGGELWQQRELYLERSPLLHADRITTPTLVLHGAEDAAVPPSQGLALYNALGKQSVETRMVRYPRAGHLLEEPRQLVHAAREIVAWFDRHL